MTNATCRECGKELKDPYANTCLQCVEKMFPKSTDQRQEGK